MKPYPSYKDSGIGWLGEIPSHWDAKALKWVIAEKLKYGANESAELDDPQLPRYIRITDFDEKGGLREGTFRSLPEEVANDYLLTEGDVLFARSGATVGKTFQFKGYKGKACYAGYLIKAVPNRKKITSDFLYLFTKSSSYENWKNSIFIQATIQNIGADKYQYFRLATPPLPEQQAIAKFLDDKTQKIDRVITIKEKQIEHLKELRTAIINQAVTKGLDPNVPMKDSGIEWLGEIPSHWSEPALKFAVSTKITDGPHETPNFIDEGVYFVSAEAVQKQTINFDSARGFISREQHELYAKKVLPKNNDILFVKSGATTGKIALVDTDKEFGIWSPLALIRSNAEKAYFKFIFFAIRSEYFQIQVQLDWSYGTQPNIGMKVLENLICFLPPLPEQQAIADYLDQKTAKIDHSIQVNQKQINQLKEYRTALISEVVTGKVDVREAI